MRGGEREHAFGETDAPDMYTRGEQDNKANKQGAKKKKKKRGLLEKAIYILIR